MRRLVLTLYFGRYPVLFGLLLAGFGPAAIWLVPRLLANVLLVSRMAQVVALSGMSAFAAALILAEYHTMRFNAPCRFPDLQLDCPALDEDDATRQRYWCWNWPKTMLWLAMAVSMPLCSLGYSLATAEAASVPGVFQPNVGWGTGIAGILLGWLCFLPALVLLSYVSARYVHPQARLSGLLPSDQWFIHRRAKHTFYRVARAAARLHRGPGYAEELAIAGEAETDSQTEKFKVPRPGHWQLTLAVGVLLTAYSSMFLAYWLQGWTPDPESPFPVAFYIVLLVALLSAIFAGASFFLDYYRVPVIVLAALYVVVVYWLPPGRDHHFALSDWPTPQQVPQLETVFDTPANRFPVGKDGRRTLVVITAPGGGIHAAAWTARVLTGLSERYGANFNRSIGLISCVSGGSIGTMFYLADFERLTAADQQPDELAEVVKRINGRAAQSSLEAIGWGIAFPDLSRALVPLVPIRIDRAIMLERRWHALLAEPAEPRTDSTASPVSARPTLREWGQRAAIGKMPIVAFNATMVSSGRRLVLSSVAAGRRATLASSAAAPLELPRDRNIDVLSAARLSATFPYVTPVAAAADGTLGHVADGGYVDNEGVLTAVDWIDRWLAHYGRRDAELHTESSGQDGIQARGQPAEIHAPPFDRVLLIRIRHTPPADTEQATGMTDTTPAAPSESSTAGWFFAAFGPATTVLSVRSTSQVERGQVEVDLVDEALRLQTALTRQRLNLLEMAMAAPPDWRTAQSADPLGAELGIPADQWLAAGDPHSSPENLMYALTRSSDLKVSSVFIDYDWEAEDAPPLNWKLTPRQQRLYERRWQQLIDPQQLDPALQKLDRFFRAR